MWRFPFYFSLGPVSYQAEQSGFPEPVREWPAKGGEILFVNHTIETLLLLLSGDFVYFVLLPLSYPVDKAGQWCVSLMSQPKKRTREASVRCTRCQCTAQEGKKRRCTSPPMYDASPTPMHLSITRDSFISAAHGEAEGQGAGGDRKQVWAWHRVFTIKRAVLNIWSSERVPYEMTGCVCALLDMHMDMHTYGLMLMHTLVIVHVRVWLWIKGQIQLAAPLKKRKGELVLHEKLATEQDAGSYAN